MLMLVTFPFMSEIVNPHTPTTTKLMAYATQSVQIQPILLKLILLARHVCIHVQPVLKAVLVTHVQPTDSMMQMMIVFVFNTTTNTIKIVELAITHAKHVFIRDSTIIVDHVRPI